MADEKDLVDQDEIERLLGQQPKGKPETPQEPAAAAGESGAGGESGSGGGESSQDGLNQDEIEALLGGKSKPASEPAAAAEAKPSAAPPVESDDDKVLGQDDIEKLLNKPGGQAESSGETASQPAAPPAGQSSQPETQANPLPEEGAMAQEDIEYLLHQAEQALESLQAEGGDPPPGVTHFRLQDLAGAAPSSEVATLDLIRDVDLDLKIELGRTHMYLEDVLKLRKGSVVPLDKLAGDPVDIYVNGRLIARGEVLVLNDNFCVRIAELVSGNSFD